MEKQRARGFMLTINNPTELVEETLKSDKFRYLVYQVESGDEKHTEHIQAFIYYENARVWPKKRYPGAHIEIARCNKAAIKYCMKEETRVRGPYEFGVRPEQGRRTDLEELASEIAKGEKKASDIAIDNPIAYVRYHRGLKALEESVTKSREIEPKVIWLWGKAGVGKTKWAFDNYPRDEIYIKDGTQWWDGYNGEKCVLIDDFDGRWPFRDLLRLLDRYPYRGQIKGGYVKIVSPVIIITCEFPPEDESMYGWDLDDEPDIREKCQNKLDQITRRLDKIIEIRMRSNVRIKVPVRCVLENAQEEGFIEPDG